MSRWYDKPTEVLSIRKDIDYIMCIDENGCSNNLAYILKQISNNKVVSEDDKYFTITGCIFTRKQYLKSKKLISSLKNKYWENEAFYDDKLKKHKIVCLHSRDIRKHNNCFSDNIINYNNFMIDLSDTMEKIDCKIISISINIYEYLKKGYTHNIYNVAFDFLLERYIYATDSNKRGIIILEARGKSEDRKLLQHINKVIKHTGTKKNKFKRVKRKNRWSLL